MARDLADKELDRLLLSALKVGPAHGYAVIEQLRRGAEGDIDLPDSAIYPALHRLEQRKLLDSDWVEIGGRRRRVYRLTDRGHASLRRLERRQRRARLGRGVGAASGVTT
ncbi:MAG: helix-turn-helix transcriptional regulator [Solirubrobacterales bacterium]|nr:helix-turn-helix transcriptional regulator [Solirubrobacterales bacterium]